jgi:molecular chaperone GrpE
MADGNGGNRNMQGASQGNAPGNVQEQQTGQPAGTAPSLEEQLAAARGEAEQYKDKYLREYADKENFRKSQERLTADRIRREKRDLLERVLEVTDNLDRALRFQDSLDREGLQQGLRMVQWQLSELLKAEGLAPIPTVGEPFNPYVHEAVETAPSAEYAEGVVTEEVRKGYRMGNETVRPARVKVSAGGQPKK